MLGEQRLLTVNDLHQDHTGPQLESRLNGIGQPGGVCSLLHLQSIDYHLHSMFSVLIKRQFLRQVVDLPIDSNPDEPCLLQILEYRLVFALSITDQGRQDHNPATLRYVLNGIDDLLYRLTRNRPPALGAVRTSDAGKEKPQIVVCLGKRADYGSRIMGRPLLIDGYCRAETLYVINVRLLHLPQELPGIGRQRLDIAALPFCIDGIERERTLP